MKKLYVLICLAALISVASPVNATQLTENEFARWVFDMPPALDHTTPLNYIEWAGYLGPDGIDEGERLYFTVETHYTSHTIPRLDTATLVLEPARAFAGNLAANSCRVWG